MCCDTYIYIKKNQPKEFEIPETHLTTKLLLIKPQNYFEEMYIFQNQMQALWY